MEGMTSMKQRRAQKKFVKMVRARAKKQRAVKIKRLSAELKRLRKRR